MTNKYETMTDYIESRLTDNDIKMWHEKAECTEHVEQLMHECGATIQIWGSHAGPEPLSVVIEETNRRLHLLETAHGTRYWRYNHYDSDESRGNDHRATINLGADDSSVDELGAMWMSGVTAIAVADAASDYETKACLEHAEGRAKLM